MRFPRKLSSKNFTLYASISKATGHKNSGRPVQIFLCPFMFNTFRIYQSQINSTIITSTSMCQGLVDTFVGVLKFSILPNNGNTHANLWMDYPLHKPFPVDHIWLRRFEF